MNKSTRIGIATALCFAVSAMFAGSVQADHHLVKIREVHNATNASDDYVVLQTYADGQNLFLNHHVSVHSADGSIFLDNALAANGASPQNQRTYLVGGATVLGADDNGNGAFQDTGGAVCYSTSAALVGGIDCVAWGDYDGGTVVPPSSPVGTPAPALAADVSIVRTIARGCPTALDAADDTDNSAADFAIGTPIKRNSSTAPTETLCTPAPPTNPAGNTPVRARKRKCKKKASKNSLADAAKKGKKKCRRKKKK
jgi:hypothetical protein